MNRISILILMTLVGLQLSAQTLTISPYSRYAIGDIFNNVSTRHAGMGGVSIATDSYFNINFQNPAGYADLLFTTMDVSAFGQLYGVRTGTQNSTQFTGGFQNLAFGFPPNKGPKLVIGFSPYSTVGYEITDRKNLYFQDTTFTQETIYSGEGGMNQLFIGLGQDMFRHKLRLGISGAARFGNTQYNWTNQLLEGDSLTSTVGIYQPTSITQDIYARALAVQGGFIYQDTLNKASTILFRIGGTAEYTIGSSADRFTTFNNSYVEDSLSGMEFGEIVFPPKFGGGISINRPGFWTIGADFQYQDWSLFQTFGENAGLSPEYKFSLGSEFAPDPTSLNYMKRIQYRVGAYYQQSYIQFAGQPVLDYGITMGIGLPSSAQGNNRFNRGRSVSRINLSVELGRRGNTNELPMEELYARFRLGVNINDTWFIKRVVD